jgi:N-acetylmuramoyl-L-alanine amidase
VAARRPGGAGLRTRVRVTVVVALVVGSVSLSGCSGGDSRPAAVDGSTTTSPSTSPTSTAPLRPAPSTTTAAGALAGKTIALDPGHNGGNGSHPAEINRLVDAVTLRKPCDTAGAATAHGYAESAFTFDVAQRLARLLEQAGAHVVLTRTDDKGVGPCITERAAIGNQARADAGVSIHADGGPAGGRGFHVIEPALVKGHTEPILAASHRLAVALRINYAAITSVPPSTYIGHDGLDVRSDLGGLNLSTVPKVFIECGNMNNRTDAALLESPDFRQRAAEALFRGLSAFLAGGPV